MATASQFLARYHAFESWNRARFERDWLLDGIAAKKVTGVIFISGDRHLAEAMRYPAERVGYTLWEVTSSPLASFTVRLSASMLSTVSRTTFTPWRRARLS